MYVQALLNPFYVPDSELTSPSFGSEARQPRWRICVTMHQ